MPGCLQLRVVVLGLLLLFLHVLLPLSLSTKPPSSSSFWGARAQHRPLATTPSSPPRPTTSTNHHNMQAVSDSSRPTEVSNHSEAPLPDYPTGFTLSSFADMFKAERARMSSEASPPRLVRESQGARLEYISSCQLPTDRGQFILHAYRHTKAGRQVRMV